MFSSFALMSHFVFNLFFFDPKIFFTFTSITDINGQTSLKHHVSYPTHVRVSSLIIIFLTR